MTLADLAALASIISSLAVIVSLAYLGLQTYQNVKHTRALIEHGRMEVNMARYIGFADTDSVAAYLEGNGQAATPDAVKRRQFRLQGMAMFTLMRNAYMQHGSGLMNEEQFGQACKGYQAWLTEPGNLAFWNDWKSTRAAGAPKFVAWVDGLTPRGADVEVERNDLSPV